MHSHGFRIQADMIVVAASIPSATIRCFEPGQIEVRQGRLVDVTGDLSIPPDARLEGYALLPGLINSHTHLEFSDLSTPLPPGKHFPEWIASVLAARRQRGPQPEAMLAQSIAAGLRESRSAGVAAVVDIVTPPWSPAHLDAIGEPHCDWSQLPVDLQTQLPFETWQRLQQHVASAPAMPAIIACLEQLGLSEPRITHALQWRDRILNEQPERWSPSLWSLGLSPHAPYSTQLSLMRETFRCAADQQRLVAMHVAESQAERLWLDTGSGPFQDLYEQLGVSVPSPSPHLIAEIIEGLAQSPRGLLIHGNYLTAGEMDQLCKYRQRVSVVYCPRTHKHFGHVPYPLEQYAERGIRVVLGTDSRSTNPDLNLWQEARAALTKHHSLRPSAALAAITDQAALAVGLGDQFGTLEPGRVAALTAIPFISPGRRNIEETIAEWFESVPHPVPICG